MGQVIHALVELLLPLKPPMHQNLEVPPRE